MYRITGIEPSGQKKFRVSVNEQFAFILYKSELLHYRLEIGKELTESEFLFLHDEVVLKRAKVKALKLLADMGRSESELRQKLSLAGFPEDIVEGAVEYVRTFGYINDREYIRSVIYSKKQSKSRKEIFAWLMQKGLSDELVKEVMEEEMTGDDEVDMAVKLLRKKRYTSDVDSKTREKIFAYLMRKGIPYSTIKEAVKILEDDNGVLLDI